MISFLDISEPDIESLMHFMLLLDNNGIAQIAVSLHQAIGMMPKGLSFPGRKQAALYLKVD